MKKHLLLLTLFLLIFSQFGFAQVTFQKAINKTIGDWAQSVHQTNDNGYIIGGHTLDLPVSTYLNIFLVKTNSSGDLIWSKSYRNLNWFEQISVQETNDGGYIIGGQGHDAFLMKVNMNGDTLWTKSFANCWEENIGASMQLTTDNGYIIAGTIGDHYLIHSDAVLIKTDFMGNTLWTKYYGGTKKDEAFSVHQTNDTGYIITGYTKSFGADSANVYLIKTDNDGDTLWTRVYGGVLDDYGNSVKQTKDGGYIVSGSTKSFGAGGSDVYLIKTDSSGNLQWSKTYGGKADDVGYSVQQCTAGGYIISGSTKSFGANGAYIIKTDNSGNLQWSKAIIGTDFKSAEQTSNGGYILAGSVFTTPGNSDILVVKTDSLGNAGCNEINPATISGTPSTLASGTSTQISNFTFTIINVHTMATTSGGADSNLCTNVGVNEIKTSPSMLVTPNPSSGNFVITFPDAIKKGLVEVYNAYGEVIFSEMVYLTSTREINLENVPAGMYFVKVSDGEKRYTQKIIIE